MNAPFLGTHFNAAMTDLAYRKLTPPSAAAIAAAAAAGAYRGRDDLSMTHVGGVRLQAAANGTLSFSHPRLVGSSTPPGSAASSLPLPRPLLHVPERLDLKLAAREPDDPAVHSFDPEQFVDVVDDDYKCGICNRVPRRPVNPSCCGQIRYAPALPPPKKNDVCGACVWLGQL
jgi:hypothetical protein